MRFPFRRSRSGQTIPDARCLFVIGAARSGTTILQNALNAAPEILILGEPNFHTDPGTPDFSARYNATHRRLKNQETKSSYCPPVRLQDGTWRETLVALGTHYRFVGAKIAVDVPDLAPLFAFQCRHFFAASTVFTFRDPLATTLSMLKLRAYVDGLAGDPLHLLLNYVEVVRLFVKMLRNQPRVRAVVHEDVTPATFLSLGAWLGVDLPAAASYYDVSQVRAHDDAVLCETVWPALAPVRLLFGELRAGLAEGFDRPQLDQNDGNLNPGHYTRLGRLARQAEMVAGDLRRQIAG